MVDPIDWLYGLQHFGIKLGLDNIRALLRRLEQPQQAFRSVLVAGTNGKGSVASMVASMLTAGGSRVGLFTSPHLVRPHERIRVDGVPIDHEGLLRTLNGLRGTIEAGVADGTLEAAPSFFEVITAAALLHFAEVGTDAAVLEVGLGGRLDATNAVDGELSIITGIDLDHTKTLGPTVAHIAREKAGIVKPGRPLVSGVVRQRAIDVIREICLERGAEYRDALAGVRFVGESAGPHARIHLQAAQADYADLQLGLPGRYQIHNARVAIAAIETWNDLGLPTVGPEAVRQGLAEVVWPGRLQWLDAEGDRPPCLLDAAHNPDGIAALATELARRPRPDAVLFGTTTGKPLEPMLAPLARHCDTIVLTRPTVRRGLEVEALEPIARQLFRRVEVEPDPATALRSAFRQVGPDGHLLITGSLYLIGNVLAHLDGTPQPGPVSM